MTTDSELAIDKKEANIEASPERAIDASPSETTLITF